MAAVDSGRRHVISTAQVVRLRQVKGTRDKPQRREEASADVREGVCIERVSMLRVNGDYACVLHACVRACVCVCVMERKT